MNYDVRAIYFTKSTTENSLQSFYMAGGGGYICLGHFDMMEVKQLGEDRGRGIEDPLSAIQQDVEHQGGGEDANFRYPLYALHQFSQGDIVVEHARLVQFWDKSTNYLTVTRLHCDRVKAKPAGRPFTEELIQRCQDGREAQGVKRVYVDEARYSGYWRLKVNLPDVGEEDVWISFYDSLELGDIVCVAKGDSIVAILEAIRHIYECPIISDAYTYCGIDKELVRDERKFTQMLSRKRKVLAEVHTDHVSTRCSVKKAIEAELFFEEVAKRVTGAPPRFYVLGTADTIISWDVVGPDGKLTEENFLKIMRAIAMSGDRMYQAFHDVVTRIGINHVPPVNSRTDNPCKVDFKEKVTDYDWAIQNLSGKAPDSWQYQLVKLLSTLRTMYLNCVMDDLSALLIPGVNALLNRIRYLYEKNRWNAKFDGEVSDFFNDWLSLTNDIFHLESQMVQHPELSPVRYFIPAMVLQFEQQWVELCARILQSLDNVNAEKDRQQKYNFEPILVPASTDNASTRCILDPWRDSEYDKAVPLRVRVPIGKLYQPWEMVHILCHEMAHYCGGEIRFRKERLDCLIECAAVFMLGVLEYLAYDEEKSVDASAIRSNLRMAADRIRDKYSIPGGKQDRYLSSIRKFLPQVVWEVASDPEFQERCQNNLMQGRGIEEQYSYAVKSCGIDTMGKGVKCQKLCSLHIQNCLVHLCKECYADIVMILLLDCSFEKYYRCVYADEERRLRDCYGMQEVILLHINRMALVSLTISALKGSGWLPQCGTESPEWMKKGLDKVRHWLRQTECGGSTPPKWLRVEGVETGATWSYLFDEEAAAILNYLGHCGVKIKESIEEISQPKDGTKADLDKLRKLLTCLDVGEFDWKRIYTFLAEAKK